jgi:hypothetical protein
MKLYGSRYEKNGKTYAKFDKVFIKIQPGKGKILLRNLFNGNDIFCTK